MQTHRELIKSLVPRLNEQTISSFLQMPDLPSLDTTEPVIGSPTLAAVKDLPVDTKPEVSANTQDPFSDFINDDFEQVNLDVRLENSPPPETDINDNSQSSEPGWVTKTLSSTNANFEISPDLDDTDGLFVASELEDKINTVVTNQIKLSNTKIHQVGPDIILGDDDIPPIKQDFAEPNTINDQVSQISDEKLEKMIGQIAQPIIEKAVWRIVPEIATQAIEKEISRLLNQKSKQQTENY